MAKRLTRVFYRRDPVSLAHDLLGKRLVRVVDGARVSGRIVEVEAYLGVPDRAAHTYQGRRTARNESMWGDAGHAYVYFTYGMHHCMNVVAGTKDEPVAVLLRALEPDEGLSVMQGRRRKKKESLRETDLCSGPAKLCQALAIDRELDGVDLVTSKAVLIEGTTDCDPARTTITTSPRIGVAYAGEWAKKPLRFFFQNNPHVSRSR